MGDKKFAFFSAKSYQGSMRTNALLFRDAETGQDILVNYTGCCIDGFPGHLNDTGELIRPRDHLTYELKGEVGPGKLQLAPAEVRRQGARFGKPPLRNLDR